jgi:hypothetical protein
LIATFLFGDFFALSICDSDMRMRAGLKTTKLPIMPNKMGNTFFENYELEKGRLGSLIQTLHTDLRPKTIHLWYRQWGLEESVVFLMPGVGRASWELVFADERNENEVIGLYLIPI